ncbi:MAG: thiamine pyrophosphate-binding protein [Candidatus Aenigmarchaeota archaeon]|nr:thiamine pyrophosphate-binding protein [Candidatus Aenigmarchaeota archaeon]
MKVSDYVVECLTANGISHGFFIIGGALGYLADSCACKNFKLYTMHHEQSTSFAAEGQAVVSKKPGLAMATSGPGATNLITGIGSAFYASLPVIFITGQVNTFESNVTGKRRQVGFQETDIVSIVRPITKYAVRISDPAKTRYEIEKAFFIATHGRNGPVLLDFPFDVQKAEITPDAQAGFLGSAEHAAMNKPRNATTSQISKFTSLLAEAKRPMLLLGHGVRLSGATYEVELFITKTKIPFVASLMGTDAVENYNPLYYGFIGTYGQRYSNLALANADLIIVLGARLDSRQVGVQAAKFAPAAKIVHVDIDEYELGASVREELSINVDIKNFLKQTMDALPKMEVKTEWISHLNVLKEKYEHHEQKIGHLKISPNKAIEVVSAVAGERDIVSVDVGSHQMWFAQSWKVKKGQIVLTNGGMGPMGCAVPTAIGAWLSDTSRRVWAVCGDGGFQINIQELQTIVRNKIPMKIIIINNNSLGMLTQFQTENFEGRLIGSVDGYDAPDFVKVANAYGIPARMVEKSSELEEAIKWLSGNNGPALLDIKVPVTYWTLPKASYARPVYDMKPFLSEQELKEALKYVPQDNWKK